MKPNERKENLRNLWETKATDEKKFLNDIFGTVGEGNAYLK